MSHEEQQALQAKIYKIYGKAWTGVFRAAAEWRLTTKDRTMLEQASKLGLDVSSIWELSMRPKREAHL